MTRPVKLFVAGDATAEIRREYPGSVAPTRNAELAFEVAGKIVEFPVEEGQRVDADALLARLDARDYDARLARARADLDKARADDRRGRRLAQQDPGAIAQITLDGYARALGVAEAAFLEAEKAKQETELRAPFAGVVARKLVDDFANVSAKQPIVNLQDTSTLEMVVSLPERDMVRGAGSVSTEDLNRRIAPIVVISSLPERHFSARILEFATAADPVTRTFSVTLGFDAPDDVRVLPGMTGKVAIELDDGGDHDALLIPAQAVVADASGRPAVWIVDRDAMTVRRAAVELAAPTGDALRVLSGLAPGQTIAVSGVHQLREGMKVSRFGE